MRVRLATSAAIAAEPFKLSQAVPSKCWQNVTKAIESNGGTHAYGWAFSGLGPSPACGQIRPLYFRWCNHILWRDKNERLWEVTPSGKAFDIAKVELGATNFISDDEAQFEFVSAEVCCPQPAIYIAARPEGEWTADCLCQAERATNDAQDQWVARALYSIKQAGLMPTNWRVKRVGDKLRDIWIMAAQSS